MVNGYSAYHCKSKNYDTKKVFPLTYIVTCFVCESEELAVKAVFPEGWKRVKGYNNMVLCPICSKKLREMVDRERIEI